ncbi:MAG: DivIVA domain-containing protein [Myxococcales bacterium]
MKLTPLDLQQKTFRKIRFGGVDDVEVAAFLELAASQLEELNRKANLQDEELRRREARIAEYQEREQLLQQTLTTAQRLGDEMKAGARKEAEIILSSAELQAEKIIAAAQSRRLQLIGEIEELKRARVTFLSQLASVVESHRALIDAMRPASDPQSMPPPSRTDDNVSFLAPPGKRADHK